MGKNQICAYCPRPATILCDWLWLDETGRIEDSDNPATCDKPLCRTHAVNQGAMFICRKEATIDTTDFCPPHATQHKLTGGHCGKRPRKGCKS